jgi:hypothetical protein
MTTSITAQINFDDAKAQIASQGNGFKLRDQVGNEVTISLNVILRCLAIAETEKSLPALPGEFWQTVEQINRS